MERCNLIKIVMENFLKYPFLEGNGKIVRHLYFSYMSDIDEDLLREIIEETLILNMEAYEMKRLRKQL